MSLLPDLPSVTLVAVTSVAINQTLEALRASMRRANFFKVLFLSDRPPATRTDPRVEWREIEPLRSRADYSRFMLRQLADHIETSHALCVQWDGYVLHGASWDPTFLDYDYIGAPWPHFSDGRNVGNGGFSLRSRRMLEACRTLTFDDHHAEDVVIGRLCRSTLEEQGMHFAPEALARRFSYERTAPTGDEFGFHGAFNLVRLLSAEDAIEIFRHLEPTVMARSERWELLRWAVRRGQLNLARVFVRRLL